MMNPHCRKWLQTSFISLLLIALLGLVMRYKIAWSLPWINQKNLLHAHSHFAFAGWVTQALMALLVSYLFEKGDKLAFTRYRPILYCNLVTAYGMLLTFPFTGYALLSITFSTLSIFVSYWFAIKFWIDLNRLPQRSTAHKWFKAAVIFNSISSLGAFTLAYMLATKDIHPTRYLACVYFFLHFQYNGWFFFACMGLLSHRLKDWGISELALRKIYFLFVIACIPAYFLSALWLPIPGLIYILIVIAVFLQLAGWVLTVQLIRKVLPAIKTAVSPFARVLCIFCGIALTIKLLLQTGSVIPSLSQLAFGFRPVIIGYLHLVLLGIISLFIIAYSVAFKFIPVTAVSKSGIIIFVSGIIINELLLMLQGISNMDYYPLPFIDPALFIAALILFSGALVINLGQQVANMTGRIKRDETISEL